MVNFGKMRYKRRHNDGCTMRTNASLFSSATLYFLSKYLLLYHQTQITAKHIPPPMIPVIAASCIRRAD